MSQLPVPQETVSPMRAGTLPTMFCVLFQAIHTVQPKKLLKHLLKYQLNEVFNVALKHVSVRMGLVMLW